MPVLQKCDHWFDDFSIGKNSSNSWETGFSLLNKHKKVILPVTFSVLYLSSLDFIITETLGYYYIKFPLWYRLSTYKYSPVLRPDWGYKILQTKQWVIKNNYSKQAATLINKVQHKKGGYYVLVLQYAYHGYSVRISQLFTEQLKRTSWFDLTFDIVVLVLVSCLSSRPAIQQYQQWSSMFTKRIKCCIREHK